MRFDEPSWWYADHVTAAARLCAPVSRIWAHVAERRIKRAAPFRSTLPVICVGNFTVGGTGKTPLSIHIAHTLTAKGERPAFLTRGYGGRATQARLVDPAIDTADDIGDEALLLARHAPTMVSKDRALGARRLEALAGLAPPSVIVMDDGLQNPSLAKDLAIAVIDARRGIGNGQVMPAGPLRASLAFQLDLADAIIINRASASTAPASPFVDGLRRSFAGPVIEASIEADEAAAATLKGANVVVLSGIANPQRFFTLIEQLGASIAERVTFPDHHAFTEADARAVLARGQAHHARIVTTEKDWVRLLGHGGARAELREVATPIAIRMQLEARETMRLDALLDALLAGSRKGVPAT